jgi:hypothetical protein
MLLTWFMCDCGTGPRSILQNICGYDWKYMQSPLITCSAVRC